MANEKIDVIVTTYAVTVRHPVGWDSDEFTMECLDEMFNDGRDPDDLRGAYITTVEHRDCKTIGWTDDGETLH